MSAEIVIRLESPDQPEAMALLEACGYRRRAAFGGYPDNGLPAFFGKRL